MTNISNTSMESRNDEAHQERCHVRERWTESSRPPLHSRRRHWAARRDCHRSSSHRIWAVATVSAADIGLLFRAGADGKQDPEVFQGMLNAAAAARTAEARGEGVGTFPIFPSKSHRSLLEIKMYAITGITGKVGGVLARRLLADAQSVRAVVRDTNKAKEWAARGCDIAQATMEDASALSAAFKGVEGVFVLPPSEFDPDPDFAEARAVIQAVKIALESNHPRKVVCLSTIGAQAVQRNLLTQRGLMEQAISQLSIPVTFLRPAWFMENFAWDVATARDEGVLLSFLQPLDKRVPMVATADVGRVAAELLMQNWKGCRVVELEARHRISPNEAAGTFARILGRPVKARAVPRDTWYSLFKSQGMRDPTLRIKMLDGFNEGWIEFEGSESSIFRGAIELDTVLKELLSEADASR